MTNTPAGKSTATGIRQRKSAKTGWRDFQLRILKGPVSMKYSRKGLEIDSPGGNYKALVRWRLQSRYVYPFDSDPRKDPDFGGILVNNLFLRRARFKVGGNLFGKWLTYAFQHDLLDNIILDGFATAKLKDWLQFRAGQGKADFDRERITSSSEQEFVERSITNRTFTVDRQTGVSVLGHLMRGSHGDAWYHVGVYSGTGRGNGWDNDGHPMIVARYQWNFLGRDVSMSSSDLEYHSSPAASLAIAGASNRSRYTRFSSGGGSQLDGFEPGAAGQYSIKQAMVEFALKYRGMYIQNENHWKNVRDNVNVTSTLMRGSHAQIGYFPHYLLADFPRSVELGYRYGYVDENTVVLGSFRQEHTVVLNWFIEAHNNKLTLDVGRVSLSHIGTPALSALRYRLQWDVTF